MVFVKQAVQTPYGQGIVEQVADLKITVRPTTWLLANNQKPIFFMNPKDVKPFFDIGDRIKCAFGVGVVESIRDSDGIYIVKLLNWALADGKSPTLYLNEQALSKEIKVIKPETKQISFDDVYPFSLQLKDSAKELFQQKKFTEAKTKYTDALERMRTIELELTNEQKARFIEMSVYCHTNLALCAFYESDFPECIRYGESTINLIEAIEKQDSTSVLIVSLQASGVTSEKLRDQKAKVWKIIAKAEVKRQNFENAQRLLKSALAICTTEKAKKEVNDLLVDVTKKLAQEKKKEKSMWQKAFEKGSEEGLSPPSSPTKKPQPANGHSSTVPTNAISSATTSNVATDEKFADFESEFSKRFASIDVSTNKKPKSTKVAAKSKDQQVVSSTFWSSERFFNTLYLTFAVGAVGGLIFWWQQRLKR